MPETSIGQILKKTRTAKKISIKQVARAIHIKEEYLEAMEKDRFDELPSPAQGRGFIRLYGSYLGIDPAEVENWLRPEIPVVVVEEHPLKKDLSPKVPRKTRKAREKASPAVVSTTAQPEAEAAVLLPEVQPSDEIIAEIGKQLKDQRNRLSLTLENIETYTHIPIHYLKALENGQIDQLPSPVQGRGMLSNYAGFLDLDVDQILMTYADALQLRREEFEQAQVTVKKKREPLKFGKPGAIKSFFSLDFFLVASLILLATIGLIWGTGSILSYKQASKNQPTEKPISEVLIATSSPTLDESISLTPEVTATVALTENPAVPLVESTGETSTPSVSGTPSPQSSYPVNVFIVAIQRSYLKVLVDGKEVFNGRTVPDTPYNYNAQRQIQLISGNAAALQINYNGQNLGMLGTTGAVLDIIFSADAYGTPTLTPTQTATQTLKPSRTPRPSNTYPPTRTKTSTRTPPPTSTPRPTHTPLGTLTP